MKVIYPLIFVALITGCSTKIKTFDKDGNPSVGIPIPKPKLIKVITTTKFKAIKGAERPDLCEEDKIEESYDYVTSSEYYYINFTPSEFAKGTFEVTFNDKGLATKINVNSEANTGVDSINSLLGTLLPYYKVPKADELEALKDKTISDSSRKISKDEAISAEELKTQSCIEKSKTIQVVPI